MAGADLGLPASAEVDRGVVTLDSEQPTALLATITSAAVEHGVELAGLTVKRPSLEDVFLQLGDDDDADRAAAE